MTPGRHRDQRPGSLLHRLSDRELQVLELIAQGCSNWAICQRLRLRPKTVEAHLRSLFAKLELERRPEENRRVIAAVTYLVRRHTVVGPGAAIEAIEQEIGESWPRRLAM